MITNAWSYIFFLLLQTRQECSSSKNRQTYFFSSKSNCNQTWRSSFMMTWFWSEWTRWSKTNLWISQVSVSSKQDVDIIRHLSHLLQKQLQLSHPLFCIGFAALQMGSHQTKFLALEQHLGIEMCGFPVIKTILSLMSVNKPEQEAGSSPLSWLESQWSSSPAMLCEIS